VASQLHDVGFNIEEIDGSNFGSSLISIDYEQHYSHFLRRFLLRNIQAGHPIRIREAEAAAAAITNFGIEFNPQVEPGHILAIDVDGNAATFSPELLGAKNAEFSDFIIGNVWDHTVEEMLASDATRTIQSEISVGVENCRASCEFFSFCRGG